MREHICLVKTQCLKQTNKPELRSIAGIPEKRLAWLKLWIGLSLLAVSMQTHASDLLSVYHDASQSSPILTADQANNQASDEQVPIALAALLPQLGIQGNVSYTDYSQPGLDTHYPSDGYSLTLTQPLFNYTAFAALANVKFTANAADFTHQAQIQNFILTVAQDYFSVLQAQDNVTFAEAQLKSLDTTLKQTEQKFEVGVGTYTDVAQARANAQSAEATLIQNQNTLADSNQTLRELTGKLETNLAIVKPDFPFAPPSPNNMQTWINQALEINPTLVSQHETTKAALANVNVKVGNQLPVVSFVATYGQTFYRQDVSPYVSPGPYEDTTTLELDFSWTVFNSGELLSSSLQAANQYASSQNTEMNLYRQTKSNVTNDFLSVVSSQSQVTADKQAVRSAQITLDDYNAKYKVGTATIVDVLNATQTLYQDQSTLAAAEYQYIDSWLQLKYDTGTLNEQDLTTLNQYLQVTQ
jgi:outer membrane protein